VRQLALPLTRILIIDIVKFDNHYDSSRSEDPRRQPKTKQRNLRRPR
jgi:hypothetical protein